MMLAPAPYVPKPSAAQGVVLQVRWKDGVTSGTLCSGVDDAVAQARSAIRQGHHPLRVELNGTVILATGALDAAMCAAKAAERRSMESAR